MYFPGLHLASCLAPQAPQPWAVPASYSGSNPQFSTEEVFIKWLNVGPSHLTPPPSWVQLSILKTRAWTLGGPSSVAQEPCPPGLTRHGEGGQESGLHGLWLLGRWRGLRRGLLVPLWLFQVFHGHVPILNALVPPVLKRFAAHAVGRVDQPLPLCGQEARQTPRRVTKLNPVAWLLTGRWHLRVSRTTPLASDLPEKWLQDLRIQLSLLISTQTSISKGIGQSPGFLLSVNLTNWPMTLDKSSHSDFPSGWS